MNKRVAELLDILRDAETELTQIRRECGHTKGYSVGMWSWRIGAYNPSRICNECRICIEGITEEESKQVWDNFNKAKMI